MSRDIVGQSALAGRRAVVMGLGLFSGGVETARWLVRRGARVLVTDLKDADALAPSLEALRGLDIEYRLGRHEEADFTSADLVVVSPAVPRESPLLALARAAGVPVETEVSLFLRACPATVTAITGSNGKSTTAALLASILEHAGRTVHLGGNIGRALINEADRMAPTDEVVLELSSFQLEWTFEAGLFPTVAVITNVTPNHLDRHGTFEAYLGAKAGILPPAGPGRAVVADHDDPGARLLASRSACPVTWAALQSMPDGDAVFWLGDRLVHGDDLGETELLHRSAVRLRGEFNLRNVAAAAAAALCREVPPEAVEAGVASFGGLPHRLEEVGTVAGVLCVNDSKATTPEAALRGLASFDGPLAVIAGGYDKKIDLAPFARALAERAFRVLLIGDTAARMEALIRSASGSPGASAAVERVGSIEEAVDRALRPGALPRGAVLLLSPGHASYGMFAHYEERGDRFRAAVLEHVRREGLSAER